jgi:hypothetical protein
MLFYRLLVGDTRCYTKACLEDSLEHPRHTAPTNPILFIIIIQNQFKQFAIVGVVSAVKTEVIQSQNKRQTNICAQYEM